MRLGDPQKNIVQGDSPEDSPLAKDLITAVVRGILASLREGSPPQVRAVGNRGSHRTFLLIERK